MGEGKRAHIQGRSATLPLRRFGTPGEVAAGVAFLMVNDWMNGATLNAASGSRVV